MMQPKLGDLGSSDWQKEDLSQQFSYMYQVVIECIRGDGHKGDIAVDDISVTNGLCSVDCNFDTGLCQWVQDDDDDFDWTWKTGSADTKNETGPPADHTSGNGHYIYIDSSEAGKNDAARIISPWQNSGKYCLLFWYYMYGKHVKELRIFQEEEEMRVEIIKITGQKEQEWIQEYVFLNTTMRFRTIIEGRVRNRNSHDLGDIAIDDILMLSCQDCGDPTPRNGNANSSNFQYNSAVEITCNFGYHIAGKPTIICQSAGTWSENPSCEPIECGDPKPEYSRVNSTDFLYGSNVEITCNTGYNISGDSIVFCQADGAWTDIPICNLIDCKSRRIDNGYFRAVSGTTYGQIASQSCVTGYMLMGDPVIACVEYGWNDTSSCIRTDSENSVLIAVYILVPIVVLALLLSVFVIFWRKGNISLRCLSAPNTNRKQDIKDPPRSGPLFTNVTYSDNQNKTHLNSLSQDTEYAVVTDEINDVDLPSEHSAYYNISDAEITKQDNIEHSYDHIKVSAATNLDNTYSHISGDNLGKVSLQTDSKSINNCSYEVLDIHESKKISGKTQQSNMHDAEYDHATSGGIDPVDLDNYSHLNDRIVASEHSKSPEAEYEQAVGETPHYFVLEAGKDDTLADDTHYFVLEKEEKVDG